MAQAQCTILQSVQYSADEGIGDQTHKHESLGSNEHECVCVNYVTEKLTLNGRGREGRQTSELLQSRSSHSATLTTHDFVTSAVTQRHLLKEGHFRNASPSTVSVNAPRDFREPGMKRQNGGDQLGTILQFAATDLDARVVPAVSAAAAEPSLLVPSSPLSVTTAPVASPSLPPCHGGGRWHHGRISYSALIFYPHHRHRHRHRPRCCCFCRRRPLHQRRGNTGNITSGCGSSFDLGCSGTTNQRTTDDRCLSGRVFQSLCGGH